MVVGSVETNEGNLIPATPMVVSGGSDNAVTCCELAWEGPGNDSQSCRKTVIQMFHQRFCGGAPVGQTLMQQSKRARRTRVQRKIHGNTLFRSCRQSKRLSLQWNSSLCFFRFIPDQADLLDVQKRKMWRVSSELIRPVSIRCSSELLDVVNHPHETIY